MNYDGSYEDRFSRKVYKLLKLYPGKNLFYIISNFSSARNSYADLSTLSNEQVERFVDQAIENDVFGANIHNL